MVDTGEHKRHHPRPAFSSMDGLPPYMDMTSSLVQKEIIMVGPITYLMSMILGPYNAA